MATPNGVENVEKKGRQDRPEVPNILAKRYPSTSMVELFSEDNKIIAERDLWIVVMKAQAELGLNIPPEVIAAYEAIKHQVDLDSILQRELLLRHDEKAKLEEFNALAGKEFAHWGMTSRDQSDNVEQMQIKEGMQIIHKLSVATLSRLGILAAQYDSQVYAERTHNQVAQISLLGKMFSNAGEDLMIAIERLESLMERYPLRGMKGAIGTQTDQLNLLGDKEKVAQLEQKVAEHLGFKRVLNSVGQVYPRSLDWDVQSTLFQLVLGVGNLATTMRLMAGQQELTEGFQEGQVGSTAMPFKKNARTCERIEGLISVLAGNLGMTMRETGHQWYGGDVSDSSTRRVSLPDSFFATDGIFQAMLTVLDEFGFYPAIIDREIEQFLPFLVATSLMMEAVKTGMGRETAHKIIKKHSVAAALRMNQEGARDNDLIDRLDNDPEFPLSRDLMEAALAHPETLVGTAPEQINTFVGQVALYVARIPEAANYMPEEIL
jgi:adenylosuccinate lyase